ncbi:39S ribosomal protein L16, mitochondrial, partial [Dufourea novaeangliae]
LNTKDNQHDSQKLYFTDVEYPERQKLRIIPKVPVYPPGLRPFKMQKKLSLLRGPEEYHNTLLHKQYGVIALGGGRLKFEHLEMIRFMVLRKVIPVHKEAFAIWRIPDLWQPITKKSQGVRMGGGKGNIHHYVTPVKAGQVILEVGGPIEYFEVKKALQLMAKNLPFAARAVSQDIMNKIEMEKKMLKEENLNPWTWKYVIQNNILGCHRWISKYDRRWFNEYI